LQKAAYYTGSFVGIIRAFAAAHCDNGIPPKTDLLMNQIKALLIKGLLHLSALLPLSVARGLGRLVGRLYWPLGGRSRKVTLHNIRAVFPELSDAEVRALARRSLIATGETAAEMGHVWIKPWGEASQLIKEVHGTELIASALREGRGVIGLAPHFGNWEVMGLHLATLGKTVSLYSPPTLEALGPIIEKSRKGSGATLVPTTSRGLAKLLKSVKAGCISGVLPDQVPPDVSAGQNSLFMGIPCFTGTLASNIIRRTGALAVFGSAQRVPGGFVVRYELADPEIYDEDNAVSLAALNRGVETCVRRCVEQYQWEYKRFRVRPGNGPGFYDDM
jgi:KDO2-lipid IV(A) lauroyltransferase